MNKKNTPTKKNEPSQHSKKIKEEEKKFFQNIEQISKKINLHISFFKKH